jgi:hypothetical protein
MGKSQHVKQAAKVEERLRKAAEYISKEKKAGARVNVTQIARQFQVSYQTLRLRVNDSCQPARRAHEAQQLLDHVQEKVLLEWVEDLSAKARPINKQGIRNMVLTIREACGRPLGKISKNWVHRFLLRHPAIKLSKPSGLDPKRAWSFNKKSVEGHFNLLESIIRNYEIPTENIYNMDEKGVQRGGGRAKSNEKFLVSRCKRPHYRKKSANLELITIIECASADGESIKPGFIFPGQSYQPEWFRADPDIW